MQYTVPQYTPSGELHDAKHRPLAPEEYVNNALQDFQQYNELIRTDLLFQTFNTPGPGPATSSAFTPPDDCLLVVIQEGANLDLGTNGVADMSITDSEGLEWVQQVFVQTDELDDDDYATGLKIWTAPVDVADAMTVVLDCGTTNMGHYALAIFAYENYDMVNPVGVKGFASSQVAGPAGTAGFNLPQAPRHSSTVLAAMTSNVVGSAGGIVAGPGWEEIHHVPLVDSWSAFQVQRRRYSTSVGVSWTSTNESGSPHFGWAVGAIEIRSSASPVLLDEMPSKSTIVINKSGGVWPGVPTERSDIVIVWRGANPPPATVTSRTLGAPGMLQGVDLGLFY